MKTLNITLPESWHTLSQTQLRDLYSAMSRLTASLPATDNGKPATITNPERGANKVSASPHGQRTTDNGQPEPDNGQLAWVKVAILCALRWNRLTLVSPSGQGYIFRKKKSGAKNKPQEYYLTDSQLLDMAYALQWIRTPPEIPVRLSRIQGAEAVPADLSHGLTFEEWLACDNLWHGYIATSDPALLTAIAAILYHKEDITLTPPEQISVFYWWASAKAHISSRFPHFFRRVNPAGTPPGPSSVTPAEIERSMNTQIRALTKGDITKEAAVLSMDVNRALTELDALAREYEDLRRHKK